MLSSSPDRSGGYGNRLKSRSGYYGVFQATISEGSMIPEVRAK